MLPLNQLARNTVAWLLLCSAASGQFTAEEEASLRAMLNRKFTFIDATDPPTHTAAGVPTGLTAVNPNDSSDDTATVQAIFDYVETSSQQAVLYFPPAKVATVAAGGYRIASTITVGPIDGLKIIGGGTSRGAVTGGNHDAFTKFRWTGGTTGPMILFQDVDGLVVEGISFQSDDGDLDQLVRHENTAAFGAGSLNLRFADCCFSTAQKLFHNGAGDTAAGTANILFDNCTFHGNHDNSSRTRYGFYNQNNQGLVYTFNHCYFLQCGTALYFHQGGRVNILGGAAAQCAQLLHVETGGVNTAGYSVRDLFIEGSGTQRMIWLSTSPTLGGKTYGPFVFENINTSNNYPSDGANFVEVSSWPGTTLTLGGLLDLRPGDTIKFYDENDHDTVLAETTVVTRTCFNEPMVCAGSAVYQVSDTCCDLPGLPSDLTTVDAASGDALFKLHGGETVMVRSCFFRNEGIRGWRLARLKTSTFDTGRIPTITFDNCTGFFGVTTGTDLFDTYIEQVDTPTFYRFIDCTDSRGTVAPLSTTNIP